MGRPNPSGLGQTKGIRSRSQYPVGYCPTFRPLGASLSLRWRGQSRGSALHPRVEPPKTPNPCPITVNQMSSLLNLLNLLSGGSQSSALRERIHRKDGRTNTLAGIVQPRAPPPGGAPRSNPMAPPPSGAPRSNPMAPPPGGAPRRRGVLSLRCRMGKAPNARETTSMKRVPHPTTITIQPAQQTRGAGGWGGSGDY